MPRVLGTLMCPMDNPMWSVSHPQSSESGRIASGGGNLIKGQGPLPRKRVMRPANHRAIGRL